MSAHTFNEVGRTECSAELLGTPRNSLYCLGNRLILVVEDLNSFHTGLRKAHQGCYLWWYRLASHMERSSAGLLLRNILARPAPFFSHTNVGVCGNCEPLRALVSVDPPPHPPSARRRPLGAHHPPSVHADLLLVLPARSLARVETRKGGQGPCRRSRRWKAR
ncbi:hypothetical protein Taro_049037 [Colocasia esculenta]|uniref:Uncharacterized protein n=1 Tax=Colocasia esculenta TaxID=4460 RepID=A0A843X9Q0_COLES|nr:hypothetical protein [Colocasia esculenta]